MAKPKVKASKSKGCADCGGKPCASCAATAKAKAAGKRSKTGDPACSDAMSQWVRGRKTGTVAAGVQAILGKCRSMARQLRMGQRHEAAGNTAKAQHIAHRVSKGVAGPVTVAERHARAKQLVAERAAKRATTQAPKAPDRDGAAARFAAKQKARLAKESTAKAITSRSGAAVAAAKQFRDRPKPKSVNDMSAAELKAKIAEVEARIKSVNANTKSIDRKLAAEDRKADAGARDPKPLGAFSPLSVPASEREAARYIVAAFVKHDPKVAGSPELQAKIRGNFEKDYRGRISRDPEFLSLLRDSARANQASPAYKAVTEKHGAMVVVPLKAAKGARGEANSRGVATEVNEAGSLQSKHPKGPPKPGMLTSSESGGMAAVLRHEHGHRLEDHALTPRQRADVLGAFPKDSRDIQSGLTKYAGEHGERERIAELFAVSTDPAYAPANFPKWVDDARGKLLGHLGVNGSRNPHSPARKK